MQTKLLVAVATLVLSACGTQRPPTTAVQPDRLPATESSAALAGTPAALSSSIHEAPPMAKAVSALIVNTTAEAVPVSAVGTTSVNGTVAATQSGAWNVGITGTPTVTVSNPSLVVGGSVSVSNTASAPLTTRGADEHARQPFQAHIFLYLVDGSFFIADSTYTVPAGKRLVVESLSASVGLPPGQIPTVFAAGQLDSGSGANVYLNVTRVGSANPSIDQWVGTSQVLAYVDGGHILQIGYARNIGVNFGNSDITVSGYLIDQ